MKLPIAVQLYSIRDEMSRDFIGSLKKVAEIGYKGVEFAGFGDLSAEKVKSALDEFGLTAVGSHTGIDLLTGNLDEVIEYNLAIGNKNITCPYYKLESKEDILKVSGLFNEIGEKIKARGLKFSYHNHAFEFKKYDGEYGLDILYRNVKSENMAAEIDAGWVFFAGVDPAAYIRSLAGRCPLVHIKDFLPNEKRDFTEIGNGNVDIKAIAAAAVDAGTEWLIAEQDESSIPSLESIRISFENLKKMGLA